MASLVAYRQGDRSFPALWFLRAVGLVLTLITLGLTAASITSFGDIGCGTPGKLSFNLAVTVISFVVLIYFLLSTGPTRPFHILPWFIFAQLALDAVLFVFWLAAAASSSYSCDDLCNACNGLYDFVSYGDLSCECFFLFKEKRTTSPNPAMAPLAKRRTSRRGGSGAATTAFDSIMAALFAFCLAATILWFFQSRKSSRSGITTTTTTTSTGATHEPIKHQEAGLAAGPTYQQQPGSDPNMQYQNQQPQQQSYPPQPQPHIPLYPQQQQQQQQQQTIHQVPPTQSPYQQPPQHYPPPHHQQGLSQPSPITTTPSPQTYYNNTSPPPTTQSSSSSPQAGGGAVEMPHLGARTMEGGVAPEVRL